MLARAQCTESNCGSSAAIAIPADGRRVPLAIPTRSGRTELDIRKLARGAYVLVLTDRQGRQQVARFVKD